MQRVWNFLVDAPQGLSLLAADWPPQFAQSNYVKLGLGVLLAFLIWLTVRNYRREGDNSPRVKGIMAAIRIATLVMLFLIAMKPTLVWQKTRTLYSDVIVLIDDSLSMGYEEDYYDSTAKEDLAKTLGVDVSQVEKMSRRQVVQSLLDREGSALLELAKTHRVRMMAFSKGDSPSQGYVRQIGELSLLGTEPTEEQIANARAQIAEALGKLTASGYETKYSIALDGALEKTRGRGCSAIITIGDGKNTHEVKSPSITQIKQQANDAEIPILSVLIGSPSRPASARVTSLRANERVLRGNEMKFSATIGFTNIDRDTVVSVQLERRLQGSTEQTDWSTVASAPKPVVLRRPALNEQNQTIFVEVSIPFKPIDVGDYEFRAVINPKVDKTRSAQVDTIARMTVVDERIRILLVSGDSGWEMQRLKDFFLRQPQLYQLSVWQQNSDKELSQAASTGMKLESLPRTLEELVGSPGWKVPSDPDQADKVQTKDGKKLYPGYNVVILYDPEPTEGGFDGKFSALVEEFVNLHGGGMVYIASNKNTEEILRNRQFDPLLDLLPVSLVHDTASEVALISQARPKPSAVRPTIYGTDHPILMIGQDPEQNQMIWSELPGIYWAHSVASIKPGARVLANHGDVSKTTTIDKERLPVIAFQRYGSGRVLYMGSDETWRWKIVQRGEYYRGYWANAVRYLSTLKPRLVDIYLAEDGEKFNVGTEIKIRARAYTEKYQPVTEKTFNVYVVNLANPSDQQVVSLKSDKLAGQDGRYAGQVTIKEPGNYEITALEDIQKRAERVASRRITVTVPEDEKKHPEADPAQLHLIATGDNFFESWQFDQIPGRIEDGRLQIPDDSRMELWDTPLALLIVVILLVVEWILRKKYNMA